MDRAKVCAFFNRPRGALDAESGGGAMKGHKKIQRVRIGFDEHEFQALKEALAFCYRVDPDDPFSAINRQETAHFLNRAIWAVCKAVISQKGYPLPLAVTVRSETKDETAQRLSTYWPEKYAEKKPSPAAWSGQFIFPGRKSLGPTGPP
jgi:hypothetical protein